MNLPGIHASVDVFGLAFQDYLNGETGENILVDINISETELLPVEYFFRSYEKMPPWEQRVMDVCRGKILDVGAGAGSHALHLQNKGLDVTAVDVSPGAVTCMKKRGVEKAVVQNFFLLSEKEKFNTILFLMNGAGMAQQLDKLCALLKHAAAMLLPGGCIYLESTDLLYMYEEEDGSAMINLAGSYYGEIIYQLQYRNVKGDPFPWLFVDFENLSDIASLAGLECEAFYRGENDNFIAKLSAIH